MALPFGSSPRGARHGAARRQITTLNGTDRTRTLLERVPESFSYLTQLRTEHARVSTLLVSLEGDSPVDKARAVFPGRVLAALEEAIRAEEAR